MTSSTARLTEAGNRLDTNHSGLIAIRDEYLEFYPLPGAGWFDKREQVHWVAVEDLPFYDGAWKRDGPLMERALHQGFIPCITGIGDEEEWPLPLWVLRPATDAEASAYELRVDD